MTMDFDSDDFDYEIGDLVPIKTSRGNTICSELLSKWTFGIYDGREYFNFLYDEKALLWFVDELEFRFNHDLKTHILGTGDLGSGKSTLSMVIYRLFKSPLYNDKPRLHDLLKTDNWSLRDFLKDSPLDLNDCCFKLEELRARCQQNSPSIDESDPNRRRKVYRRNFYIVDESGKELSSHRWQDRYVEEMKQQLDISRVKREIILMNLPHVKGIIKGIRDSNADYLTHCMVQKEGNQLHRGLVEFREADKSRWDLEVFWKGLMACKFPKLEDSSYYDYMDKKLDYVQASGLDSSVCNEAIESRKLIGARLQSPEFMAKLGCKPFSQSKAATIIGVDRKTIRRDSRAFADEYGHLPSDS